MYEDNQLARTANTNTHHITRAQEFGELCESSQCSHFNFTTKNIKKILQIQYPRFWRFRIIQRVTDKADNNSEEAPHETPHTPTPLMIFTELACDIQRIVLGNLRARDLARFAATCRSAMTTAEEVLKQRMRNAGLTHLAEIPSHDRVALYLSRLHWLNDEISGAVATGLSDVFCVSGCGTITQCRLESDNHTKRLHPTEIHPSPIPSLIEYTMCSIATGYGFASAVTTEGVLFTWGECRLPGLLGHGDNHSTTTPVQVQALQGQRVRSVANGPSHCIAITEAGTAWSWGLNTFGQCGRGTFERIATFPQAIDQLRCTLIRSASCGFNHTLFVTTDGKLFIAGGHADIDDATRIPREVDELRGHHIINASAGLYHSLALSQKGDVLSWGQNSHGQLGRGEFAYASRPEIVNGVTNVHTIAAGGKTSCAITTACATFMWGEGYGQEPQHAQCEDIMACAIGARDTVSIRRKGGIMHHTRNKANNQQ